MASERLISVAEAQEHVTAGTGMLVCAYDSDDKFNNAHLEGAIPLSEFKARTGEISADREIIFY